MARRQVFIQTKLILLSSNSCILYAAQLLTLVVASYIVVFVCCLGCLAIEIVDVEAKNVTISLSFKASLKDLCYLSI